MSDQPGSARDDVAERLRRLQQLGVKRGRAAIKTPQPPPVAPARAASTLHSPGQSLLDLVGGRLVTTAFGPCHVVETRFPLDETRGGWPLGAALAIDGAAVAACSRSAALSSFDFRRAAFLDTETSGLSGGAGTFAFMVGIGTFEGGEEGREGKEEKEGKAAGAGEYVVRQVFMDNPGQERALLTVLGEVLARCTGLVSFNGRAFDAPLLETRYLLNREPSPLRELLHFDLLPAARQRWRLRLPSRSLGSLERDILAFQRSEEDVPGWLIPSIYQQYARGGEALTPQVVADVAHIFYHNLHDIVNMTPLAAILCAPFRAESPLIDGLHPVDLVCLARCFEELAWHNQGESAYRRALGQPLPPEVRAEALNRLAWMLKRQERRGEAVELWQDWITSVPGHDITPYVELAKHHEWHDIDLAAARKWTLWAVHVAGQMPTGPDRELAQTDLQRRLERLERKLGGEAG